jgi:hypothetical protein
MEDLQKIRFLTVNHSKLQGLKSIPVSLLLLATVLWANFRQGPSSNLTLPLSFALVSAILYWWINRFYKLRYGQVERTAGQKRWDFITGILAGIAGLGAFMIDTAYTIPVSMVGFVFAAAILFEYLYTFHSGSSPYYFWQMLIGFTVIVIFNLLPLFGLAAWWQWFGLRSHFVGVLAVTGVVLLAAGLAGHIHFIRQFPSRRVNR